VFPADGVQNTIRAYVYDVNNNGVEIGTSVNFTATPIGTVYSPSNVLNSDGLVETYISSNSIGTTFLSATSGAARSDVRRISFTPKQGISMSLTVSPLRIVADGFSTASITATVLDTNSAGVFIPVSDGLPVSISLTDPTYGTIDPPTAFTLNGRINATLRSGTHASSDTGITLTASANSALERSVNIVFLSGAPSTVTFDPVNPMDADGIDTQTVFVTILDEFGNPVSAGRTVTFNSSRGTLIPATTVTDTLGRAQSLLTSSTSHGLVTLTATCGGITGFISLSFSPITATNIDVVASPISITANGVSTSNVTVVATTTDGSPVSDGSIIHFSQTAGFITPTVATTTGGIARAVLTSGTTPNPLVYVKAWQGLIRDSTIVSFVPGGPANIVVTTTDADSTIIANSTDTCRIIIAVTDSFNQPVSAGVPVTLTTTLGTIVGTVYTDAGGTASALLRSGTISGFSVVRATAGSGSGQIVITFAPTVVTSVNLVITPTTIEANGSGTANVIVTATVQVVLRFRTEHLFVSPVCQEDLYHLYMEQQRAGS
jgi:adhesin/invasin